MDNYSSLNVSTKQGEGDATILGWKNLDAAANRIYQEQQKQELLGQKHYAETMDALGKQFSKVRNADVPEITKTYNDLQELLRQYHFDKKADKIELQKKINEKNQEFWAKTGQSLHTLKGIEELGKTALTNPERLNENYNASTIDKTPSSQLTLDNYIDHNLYANLDAAHLKALGTPKDVPIGVATNNGLEITQPMISQRNTLLGYNQSLQGEVFGSKKSIAAATDAMRTLASTPQGIQQMQQIKQQFDAIPDAELAKMGVTKKDLEKIAAVNPNNLAEQYVVMKTMQTAINKELYKDIVPNRHTIPQPKETMAEKIALHRAYKKIDAEFARMSDEQQGKWIDKKIEENTPKAEPSTNALYPFNTKLTSPIEDPLILGALAKGDEMPNLQYNHQTGKYLLQVPLLDKENGKPLYIKKEAGKADSEVSSPYLTDKEIADGVELVPIYKREATLDKTQLKDLMAENIKNQKFIMNERGLGKNKKTLTTGSNKSNGDGSVTKEKKTISGF